MEDDRWKPLDEKYLTDKVKLQLREKSLCVQASYQKKNIQNYINKNEGQVVFNVFNQRILDDKCGSVS